MIMSGLVRFRIHWLVVGTNSDVDTDYFVLLSYLLGVQNMVILYEC